MPSRNEVRLLATTEVGKENVGAVVEVGSLCFMKWLNYELLISSMVCRLINSY